jgi:Ser/Thr protein kinase RdoA (MazF antagonist)
MQLLPEIFSAYGLDPMRTKAHAFGSGLINHTWKLETEKDAFILQKINQQVFRHPEAIAANINSVAEYLKQHSPDYLFVAPLPTREGMNMLVLNEEGVDNYYRLIPFVQGSHSLDVLANAGQAYEAASQFGLFTRLLSGFPAEKLHITLPHFHDLTLRYQQFQQAINAGNPKRISESKELIQALSQQAGIVTEYTAILKNPFFKKRVTHHDTKISNVLFDAAEKAICVIDLDTLMPGYFISDVGDMMRTYLCTVSEEASDFTKIHIRDDVYWAIVDGYAAEMNSELTKVEKNYFFYAGKFMIYMQALRFITDYLNEDVYYGAKYPQQNFVRAGNQWVLLQRLLEKESLFS